MSRGRRVSKAELVLWRRAEERATCLRHATRRERTFFAIAALSSSISGGRGTWTASPGLIEIVGSIKNVALRKAKSSLHCSAISTSPRLTVCWSRQRDHAFRQVHLHRVTVCR